jgi:hypothetical protein
METIVTKDRSIGVADSNSIWRLCSRSTHCGRWIAVIKIGNKNIEPIVAKDRSIGVADSNSIWRLCSS